MLDFLVPFTRYIYQIPFNINLTIFKKTLVIINIEVKTQQRYRLTKIATANVQNYNSFSKKYNIR